MRFFRVILTVVVGLSAYSNTAAADPSASLAKLLNVGATQDRFHARIHFRLFSDPQGSDLVEQMSNEIWHQGGLYLSRDQDRDLLFTNDQVIIADHGAQLVMVRERSEEIINFPDLTSFLEDPAILAGIQEIDGGYEVEYPVGSIKYARYELSDSGEYISRATLIYRESEEWAELSSNPRIDVEYSIFDTDSLIPESIFSAHSYFVTHENQLLPGSRVTGYRVIDHTNSTGTE